MIRTQIQLTVDQARGLREQAQREGRSMADLVRGSVTEYLTRHGAVDRETQARRALELAGRFRSRAVDEHDGRLEEAFGE